jgi:dTDP-4-dehydrorhamnose reductase
MKVLVLGSGGQVGRALCASTPRHTEIVAPPHAALDIRHERDVQRAVQAASPDIVFNAAAYSQVDRAEGEREIAEAVNARGARNVAMAAHAAGARLVHLSTDYVFDGMADRPYAPKDAPHPLNVYGETKRAGESAVMQEHPSALIVRTSWVYAPQGRNFLQAILQRIRGGQPLRVVDDQTGVPTSAASLASALWALSERGVSGLLHYCDSGTATWHAFAREIHDAALEMGLVGRAVTITPISSAEFAAPARRPPYSVLDARATWAMTGVPPHWRTQVRAVLEGIAP